MKRTFTILILCILNLSWSESSKLEDFFELTKNQDYDAAKTVALNLEEGELKSSLLSLVYLLSYKSAESKFVELNQKEPYEVLYVKYLILGYQNTFAFKQNNLEAYKNFSMALKLAEKLNNPVLCKAALISLLDLFKSEIFIGSKQYSPFLEQFIKLKSDLTDEALIVMYSLIFFTKADSDLDSVDLQYYSYNEKLDSIFSKFPISHNFNPKYYYEKGIYYKIEEDFEKSEDFFLKADSLVANNDYQKSFRGDIAWQLASINMQNEQLQKAKNYLKVSENLSSKLRDTFYNNRLSSFIFRKEKKYDSAYHYLRKSVDVEYQLGYKNNTLESSILTVQNQTDKLKLDKLELDTQNRKNRNLAATLGLLLFLGTIIAFLTYNSTKRKQLLAEQEKSLQEQKVTTLLKEQELTIIDAMIAGQEKERQRIANDLHDDLGGLMATVKLHFNSLELKIKEDADGLYGKTNRLIDEAYNKIRAIAHAKNSGVIAKQGLLRAIEQLAEKVSTANGIVIDVQDFGLDYRLENSLELTLFRIIQELITNIIKHAKATMANIHLTNHSDSLNIIVEDNGVGFQSDKMTSKWIGMGLKSIDKRLAHLEGTMHIESKPNKGATIIIDIPL